MSKGEKIKELDNFIIFLLEKSKSIKHITPEGINGFEKMINGFKIIHKDILYDLLDSKYENKYPNQVEDKIIERLNGLSKLMLVMLEIAEEKSKITENKMTTQKLKQIIQEEIQSIFEKYGYPEPTKTSPERETITKPKEPVVIPKRRTLNPPDPSKLPKTKPKAFIQETDNEQDLLKKITAKFVKLKHG